MIPQSNSVSRPTGRPVTPDGRLPIVIGVTGHRNLRNADLAVYRAQIGEFFDLLRTRYPATPLRVVSPLAAGADRLVAQIALDRGYELIVPLPFSPADYERDFPDSVEEFRGLMQRVPPEQVFVWPRSDAGNPRESREPQSVRDQQYREVGAFVVEQSHILLAIWDGVLDDADAGTSAMIGLKLGQSAAAPVNGSTALDPEDSGPVFRVHAVRAGSTAPLTRQVSWIFPQDNQVELFDTVCSRIDRFNCEPARSHIHPNLAAVAASLLPGVAAEAAADPELGAAFAVADRLAAHYQRITYRTLRLTLSVAAMMALSLEIYSEILPLRVVPLTYLLLFAFLTLIFVWHGRLDAQGRYLDYRALAEGLRVQFYWRLAGLADTASSSYLRNQLDELRWIREALRATAAVPPPARAQPDVALTCWVHGQAGYYAGRAQLHDRRSRRMDYWSRVSLGVGLLAAGCLVLLWTRLQHLPDWHHGLVLAMSLAPIVAALWQTYSERSGARTQANQFARFAAIFRRAERFVDRLESGQSTPERRRSKLALLRELGREALMESANWVLLLRERPMALPKS
ncbi:MAG TPA: hypothetical protein VMC02_08620 [Steroidobacteraceae bacterium]|nr:hypothetical protein [Steroidobacteraceae bacterium]